jgi:DNA-directed RNA polymerase subunit RPC12/RpoP
MHYKCFTCGEEFDDIQQLASHKRSHQGAPERKPGVICLNCGKPIPIPPAQKNFSGLLPCPNCHRSMTVKLEDGEVIFARVG